MLPFLTDDLDNLNFPNSGVKSNLKWTKEMKTFGSDYDHEQIFFLIQKKPVTYNSHNLTAYLKLGTTYNNNNNDEELILNDSFILGGLF